METPVTPAAKVIKAFDGVTKLADALECDKSTVSCWNSRGEGLIPSKWQAKIMDAAKRLNIDLNPADLVATGGLAID